MSRILLVEDNPTNLELLRYLLQHGGHEVHVATNGEEGVLRATELLPDIVLCDLRMPRLDGYALLQQVRSAPALDDVIVIAVTAYSMPDDYRRVTEAGFDGYLTKPIVPETFVAQVEALLAAGRRAS